MEFRQSHPFICCLFLKTVIFVNPDCYVKKIPLKSKLIVLLQFKHRELKLKLKPLYYQDYCVSWERLTTVCFYKNDNVPQYNYHYVHFMESLYKDRLYWFLSYLQLFHSFFFVIDLCLKWRQISCWQSRRSCHRSRPKLTLCLEGLKGLRGNIAQMLVRFVTCLHTYGLGLRVFADHRNEMFNEMKRNCSGRS